MTRRPRVTKVDLVVLCRPPLRDHRDLTDALSRLSIWASIEELKGHDVDDAWEGMEQVARWIIDNQAPR